MRAKFSFQGEESGVVDFEITPQTAESTQPIEIVKNYADTESDTVEMSIVGCLQYDKTRKKILVSGLKSNGATLNDQHNFSQLTDSIYSGIGEAFSSVRISHHKTPTSFEVLPPVEGEVGENLYNFLDNKTFNTCSYVTITGKTTSSGGDVDLDDFDYAVIRYSWSSSDGTDLDTRTYIETPDRKENTVGWDRMVTDSTYLSWNDDNREDGVESVLLNMADIKRDFSSHDKIVVSINAFWYAAVLEGNVKVSFETYKGGRMVASGYDWINVGGVSVQTAFVLTNTRNDTSVSSNDGDRLATFQYDFATGKSKLINNKPASDDSADDEYNPVTCRKSTTSYTVKLSPPEALLAISYRVNDGTIQTLKASELGVSSLDTDHLLGLCLTEDGQGFAFLDQTAAGQYPEMSGGSSSQSATFHLSGISNNKLTFNGVDVDITADMGDAIHYQEDVLPVKSSPEVTKLEILPTPSVARESDIYYKFAGSESGEPLKFYSCERLDVSPQAIPVPSDFSTIFEVQNNTNHADVFSISADRAEDGWKIFKNDVLMADSSGYKAEGVESRAYTSGGMMDVWIPHQAHSKSLIQVEMACTTMFPNDANMPNMNAGGIVTLLQQGNRVGSIQESLSRYKYREGKKVGSFLLLKPNIASMLKDLNVVDRIAANKQVFTKRKGQGLTDADIPVVEGYLVDAGNPATLDTSGVPLTDLETAEKIKDALNQYLSIYNTSRLDYDFINVELDTTDGLAIYVTDATFENNAISYRKISGYRLEDVKPEETGRWYSTTDGGSKYTYTRYDAVNGKHVSGSPLTKLDVFDLFLLPNTSANKEIYKNHPMAQTHRPVVYDDSYIPEVNFELENRTSL